MIGKIITSLVINYLASDGWKIALKIVAWALRELVEFKIEFSPATEGAFTSGSQAINDGWLTRDEFCDFLLTLKVIPGFLDDIIITALVAGLKITKDWKIQLVPNEGAAAAISKMLKDRVIEGWEIADVIVEVAK